jgi:hypothetical protein
MLPGSRKCIGAFSKSSQGEPQARNDSDPANGSRSEVRTAQASGLKPIGTAVPLVGRNALLVEPNHLEREIPHGQADQLHAMRFSGALIRMTHGRNLIFSP